jgi:hypothetical protein
LSHDGPLVRVRAGFGRSRLPTWLVFVREKYTKERTGARRLVAEYLQRFAKDRYQTAVESWRELQSQNIKFTMKRLREPIDNLS